MIKRLARYAAIILGQDRKIRFIISRILWRTSLCKLFLIKRDGYILRFYPTSLSASLWVSGGRLESEGFLAKILLPGDTVLDIGANIGTMTLKAASLVKQSGQVFAFEANPKTFEYLAKNVSLNDCDWVKAYNFALGSEEGYLRFSNSGSDDQHSVSSMGEIEVQVRKLDSFNLPKMTLVKIDVEGYEKFVIIGGTNTLASTEMVYYESNEAHTQKYGYSSSELVELLSGMGFSVFIPGPGARIRPIPTGYISKVNENLIAIRDVDAFRKRSGYKIELYMAT